MIMNNDLVMMDDVVGFPYGWCVLSNVEGRAPEVGRSQANHSVSRQNHHGVSMFLRGHFSAFFKNIMNHR